MGTFLLYMELTLFEIFRRMCVPDTTYYSVSIFSDGSGFVYIHNSNDNFGGYREIIQFNNEEQFMQKMAEYANLMLGGNNGK